MKKLNMITKVVIGMVIATILIWDLYVIIEGGTGTTISNRLIVWAYEYPAFSFAMGFVMGHLFWRMPATKELKKILDRRK